LGEVLEEREEIVLYPANHYVTPQERVDRALPLIEEELGQQLEAFRRSGKVLESQRLEQRTRHDMEMMQTTGVCNGIENYSRFMDGRSTGQSPFTLLHYFPDDWLLFVDESHVAVPQVGAMFKGDRSRKETLVEHGFRLPSALDNRPLRFEEFEQLLCQVVYVSATPSRYELEHSEKHIVEQVVRPTGLLDPLIVVRPAATQVDDLLAELRKVIAEGWRVLVTTLTKRSAEELTTYYSELDIRVRYLHSEIDVIERSSILRDLRAGEFDVLVGINLLREGLDLPEVALVAVLDADKEGFLRASTSLIQTCGRASRNEAGRVLFYGDRVTDSMQSCLDEVVRRRIIQEAYNEEHGLVPTTIIKPIRDSIESMYDMDYPDVPQVAEPGSEPDEAETWPVARLRGEIQHLRADMLLAAEELRFEEAVDLRDRLNQLEDLELKR
jgi:excinuclease ABC subunit B